MNPAGPPISVRDIETPASDPVVRAATGVIGGPLGRYSRVTSALPWQPAAVALTLIGTLMLAAGTLQKGYCTANGWAVPDVFWRACYSDLPFLFSGSALQQGDFPYAAEGSLSQPVLTGLTMWVTSLLVPGDGDPVVRQRWYFGIWVLLILVLLALLIRVVARCARRNPWRAAHVAASPLILTVALVSADLLGVLLATYGLWCWSRRRPALAGVAFGLAISARTYPILILLVIGLLALRSGRTREWLEATGVALLTWVALLAAVGLPTAGAPFSTYQTWWNAGPDYGSLWYLPTVMDVYVSPAAATGLAVAGWLLAVAAGGVLALGARRRPTIAEVSIVVVGLVLVTGKALPVQSSLWLLPLIALAGFRWRDHLIWAGAEAAYFVAIWLYLGGLSDPNRGLPLPWLAFFSLLRIAGICWLVAVAWRSASRRPALAEETQGEPDADHDPDDVAGPLAGRRDQVTLSFA